MPVNTAHAEYTKFAPKWKRCRDVAAGQDAVHAAGVEYLPKLKDQSEDDYKAYKMRATFYNATWRTIAGLIGMMLRKPPTIDIPETAKPLLEDVDAAGEPMSLFAQAVCEQSLTTGRLGVLVDVPPVRPSAPGTVATMADAATQNIRPTLQLYRAESIINWRTGRVNNKTILTLVVLKESEAVPKDDFEAKDEDRWRVLDLPGGVYRQRLFKRKDPQQGGQLPGNEFEQIGEDVFPVMGGKTMGFIPFQFLGTDDTSSDVDEPPLIDLVDLNLSHYRTTADYAHGCHFTGLPTLFLAGFKQENPSEKIYIGSEAAIVSTNENAKAEFIEFTGQGLQALEKKLASEEQQMAVLGARMLEPQKKATEAADSASIRRKGEESMLASVAQAISLGLTQALKWFVAFTGATNTDGVKFELNRDFYPATAQPAQILALLSAWQSGAISDQVLFGNFQKMEIIDKDVKLEEEQARIAERQQQLAEQSAAAIAATDEVPQ